MAEIPQFGWHSLMALGGILPLLFAPAHQLPESGSFSGDQASAQHLLCAILNRLYPGPSATMWGLSYPAQPATGATRCALSSSRQYGFGSLMLWLVYFMGLLLVCPRQLAASLLVKADRR
ncbi:hypothetical protein MJ579_06660 [Klebsiella pneumoniae]|nr:hypothetical protein MJ579_06660 [Klebsiella pneumoniae]